MIFLPYVYVLETQEHRLGLAGLLVVPCLGLVWPGPVLPALPATTTAAAQPPAAEGGRLLLLDQAKARRARQARQGQARASQGKAQQASQPSQGRHLGWLAGQGFWLKHPLHFRSGRPGLGPKSFKN